MTAVLVAHDGERWLQRALAGLAAQTRPPQRTVAVDTGSNDRSADVLRAALGSSHVLSAPRDTGFGAAVQIGLDAYAGAPAPANGPRASDGVPVEWVWLLHDDCEPDPRALEELLRRADASDVAVVGPKVRGWDDQRRLLEIGLTTDAAGHRHTGLERGELDQGQHDHVDDVLAVGSPGALIRRDVWDALGGYDAMLPVFRDDLDFGWRANAAGHRVVIASDAVVHHAQAAASGQRHLAATADHPRRVDRRNAMATVLANSSLPGFAWGVVRLALATVVQALVFLLTRRPLLAADEVAAYLSLLARLPRVLSSRRAHAATATVRRREVRSLLARRGARLRGLADHVGGRILSGSGRALVQQSPETGPTSDDVETLGGGPSVARRLLQPGLLLVLGVLIIAVIGEHRLLGLHGTLLGGRLLPPPGSAHDLWQAYLAAWHPASIGSGAPVPSYVAVLAALSSVLFGKVWLAVDVLLFGCVPLAALTAYIALRGVVRSLAVRLWAAATYALLPVGVGAVAGGRLGVAVAFALLPMVVRGGVRALVDAVSLRGWRHAWWTGLLLAIAVAFSPQLYLVAVPVLVASSFVVARLRGGVVRSLLRAFAAAFVVLVVPIGLLLPWTLQLWRTPGLLVVGTGAAPVAALDRPFPRPSDLLFAWPGGVGVTAWWLTGGLLLGALAVLVRRDRLRAGVAIWLGIGVALVVGTVLTRVEVRTPAGAGVHGWPGVVTALIGAALVTGCALAADGAQQRLTRKSFGWRQPLAAIIAVLAAITPVLLGVHWIAEGTPGPLRHGDGSVLPAFVGRTVGGATGVRALVVRTGERGVVEYDVVEGGPPRLGTADVVVPSRELVPLDAAVRSLSGGGSDAAARLATYAIGYVCVVRPSAELSRALDAATGLSRQPSGTDVAVWKVTFPASRVAVLDQQAARSATSGTSMPSSGGVDALSSHADGVRVTLPPGRAGRLLVFAAPAGSHWVATLDGNQLPRRTAFGWAQAFALPEQGGSLVVRYDDPMRRWGLGAQVAILVLVLILAAPAVRTDDGPPTRVTDRATGSTPHDVAEPEQRAAATDATPADEAPALQGVTASEGGAR